MKQLVNGNSGRFHAICAANKLNLNYKENQHELSVLDEVFIARTYADYFPFHTAATVIDVGAHYGYFSIFAAMHTAPKARIFAIEPAPMNFSQLKRNLSSCNVQNVTAVNVALGGSETHTALHLGAARNHSLIADYELLNSGNRTCPVQVNTLNSFMNEHQIEHIDFIKIDCEGAEYALLEACDLELLKRITTVSMEFHDLKSSHHNGLALVKRLADAGFTIAQFKHEPTTMNLNYGKIIATRQI